MYKHPSQHQTPNLKPQYIYLVQHSRPKGQNDLLFDCLLDAKQQLFFQVYFHEINSIQKQHVLKAVFLHVIYMVFDSEGQQAHNNRPFQLYYSEIAPIQAI